MRQNNYQGAVQQSFGNERNQIKCGKLQFL